MNASCFIMVYLLYAKFEKKIGDHFEAIEQGYLMFPNRELKLHLFRFYIKMSENVDSQKMGKKKIKSQEDDC